MGGPNGQQCQDCYWYDQGICVVEPPAAGFSGSMKPATKRSSWCGRWANREKQRLLVAALQFSGSLRSACQNRQPLDGASAQALERALAEVEHACFVARSDAQVLAEALRSHASPAANVLSRALTYSSELERWDQKLK